MPTQNIQPFTFPETGSPVRVLTIDGEPWWVARDVCDILGIRNAADALSSLDDDEKGLANTDTLGGVQQMATINEPGLYSLILRSRKPQARTFKRWITHDVIPSIRRTGAYVAPHREPSKLELARDLVKALETAEAANARIAELEPAAHSWTHLAAARGDYTITDAAKILARDPSITIRPRGLFDALANMRWAYRGHDGAWRAYQTAINTRRLTEKAGSYTHPRTGDETATVQVRVTVKGLAELHRRLGGTTQLDIPFNPAA